jgi:NADPH-dependent curcumin reductase CurA
MMGQSVRLTRRPDGLPGPGDFKLFDEPEPQPDAGEFVVAVRWLALDPFIRWRLSPGFFGPLLSIGDVLPGLAVGQVAASRHPDFAVGDWVHGPFGWRSHVRVGAAGVRRLTTDEGPPELALTLLGLAGLTAYFGLFEVGGARAGETVLVSGAGGSVGAVVGQLAALAGLRAIGAAGGPARRAAALKAGRFAVCLDRRAADVGAALAAAAPDGIDIYFDNVGGRLVDAVLPRLNPAARVVLCGLASQYNGEAPAGIADLLPVVLARAELRGFRVLDFAERFPAARARLLRWWHAGAVRVATEEVAGLAAAPEAFGRVMRGETSGKLLVVLPS